MLVVALPPPTFVPPEYGSMDPLDLLAMDDPYLVMDEDDDDLVLEMEFNKAWDAMDWSS